MSWMPLILLALVAVCGGAWLLYRYMLEERSHTGPDDLVPGSSARDTTEMTITLPSKHPYFSFNCSVEVAYAAMDRSTGTLPKLSAIEWTLYKASKDIAVSYALPQKEQLKHELASVFGARRTLPDQDFVITAYCLEVTVDPEQLEAVQRGYQEDLDSERLKAKVTYLSQVFDDPRTATMWWLAQNSANIDELPDRSDMLFRIDRLLNPDHRTPDLPIQDLEWFLENADDAGKAAVGVALAGIYRRFEKEDFAKEAERLIPNRTPPSRNRSKPDDSDG